ncbi:hypothetical protein [Streptomyces pilosus]|uniref:hypothetical protein n=1 Tax=Streptomyces pilosus TaxID=28893 RepID=UPI00363AD985
MNTDLTNPQQTRQPALDDQADRLIAAVNEALAAPTRYRDETPVPAIGNALPVPQPGRTPMSQRATDLSVMMLSAGAASIPFGGMTALVIYALGNANPVSLAIGAGAPIGLAIPILALSRVVKRAKETVQAAPPVIHQHYTGTVVQDQRQVNTINRGIVANTRNQLPR